MTRVLHFATKFCFPAEECACTADYGIVIDGKLVHAYCKAWDPSYPKYRICYLSGGLSASICPGALRSSRGDFYYTNDENVCKLAQPEVKGTIHL